MKQCPNTFYTCPEHLQHWYTLCTESIVGGFSSPLAQTTVEVGKTKISPHIYGDEALTCEAFEVQDFNSLYPAMMSVSNRTHTHTHTRTHTHYSRLPVGCILSLYFRMIFPLVKPRFVLRLISPN